VADSELRLEITALPSLPEVRPGDDLGEFIARAAPDDLADSHVIAVAHKVVSKAEGRVRVLEQVTPADRARSLAADQDKDPRHMQVILDETQEVLRAEGGVMICVTRNGLVCANAGVDASNAEAGEELRGVRPAVVVTDSFGRPWRTGQTDVAIGAAGLAPIDDWRGRADALGRTLRGTAIAVADVVAAAADLARTKDSSQPAVLVRGLGRFVAPADGPGAAALRRAREQDLFR